MELKREKVSEILRNILIKHLFCGEITEDAIIEEDTSLAHDLAADSLDLIEILMDCEDTFDIDCEIPNETLNGLETFGQFVDFIIAQHKEQNRPV